MTTPGRDDAAAIRTAMFAAGAMIAFQVGGRATRDALFLSSFPATYLPRMVLAGGVLSLLSAFVVARAMARRGPVRLVPALFATSAVLLLLEFGLLRVAHGPAIVLFFAHFSAMGAILVSSFYSLLNERFDPRAAKRAIGRIGSAGTGGGVIGGLLVMAVAARLSVAAMLPVLAILHAGCAVLVLQVGADPRRATEGGVDAPVAGPLRTLAASPYLRAVAAMVLLTTVSENLLDQVFKTFAAVRYPDGVALAQVLALLYMSTNVLGVALAAGFGRRALERLGLARTVGILPWTVAAGGAAAFAMTGFVSVLAVKASENVVRNSLYRSGYELLFTPLPPGEKRAVKALIDVGAVRLGDIIFFVLAQSALWLVAAQSSRLMLLLAVACGGAAILLIWSIQSGYIATLERNLLSRAVQLDLGDITDSTTRETLMRAALPTAPAPATHAPDLAPRVAPHDPVVARLAELRSLDPERVRQALRSPLEPNHVAHVIESARTGADQELIIGTFYAGYQTTVNLLALALQLLVVGRVIKFLGIARALVVLPVIAFGGYALMAFVPLLGAIRWAKILENATDYSLQNTVRQALFLPTTREEKYAAKQAIDGFFVRMGDVLQAVLVVYVGAGLWHLGPRQFAMLNLVLVAVWITLAVAIGRRYARMVAAT